ncbi:MAG: cellobiose phosphorylase [Vagococcus sp.]|uniref:GH36-type glycosyl hydrolase domain-containing protein n=1 Tax=Vagococcus sp. TaxID=1933889 RepID=UPI002FCA7EF4
MKTMTYTGKNVSFTFLPHGDIREIVADDIMLNQLIGSEYDGSINNIFLRVYEKNECEVYPLIGKRSKSTTEFFENGVLWTGKIKNINYVVEFSLSSEDQWFWHVQLCGDGELVDLVYGQDVGLASQSVVVTNEAYNSQYVDHSVYHSELGHTVCSRQNMPQSGVFPYLQQGSLTKNDQFSTDGYQFFEKNETNDWVSRLRTIENLPSEVYQYEMAYTGLQSEKMTLNSANQNIIFYGVYLNNHESAVLESAVTADSVKNVFETRESLRNSQKVEVANRIEMKDLSGETLSIEEIDRLFPERRIEEKSATGQLLSFFDSKDYHVVLKEKELQMERSHGHIIISGEEETIDHPVMASTLYMNGLFNSQIVLGNTTVNKFISNTRSVLNLLEKAGQRLFVKVDGDWLRLGLPSAFKMGFNFATWYYKIDDDLLKITSYTVDNTRSVKFSVKSESGKGYDWLTSFDIVMNDSENRQDYTLSQDGQLLTFVPKKTSAIYAKYPDLRYYIESKEAYNLVSAAELFNLSTDENLTLIEISGTSSFSLTIQGTLSNAPFFKEETILNQASESYNHYIASLSNQFSLEFSDQARIEKMNALVKWYTHNMLVHYLSPHGLEQYGGAAWGTRDVCQGPIEYFFAMNKPEIVRSIILTIYANQFDDDGNWPQWFMFDKFEEIKADESHGDIIVWPLKVVGDYLNVTEDYSILEEIIPYASRETFKKTKSEETLLDHIDKQLTYIENNFLEGTFLSCYGDGDWDDTLQPADQSLRKNMASSWTVALTYQTLNQFYKVMESKEQHFAKRVQRLSEGVYQDFHKYMLNDEVIPGFLLMQEKNQPELIVHPHDKRTGIDYRLLPMTRSMISELIDEEEVAKHFEIIEDNLKFPDAVRLMNKPANYAGGVSKIFKRAEQAANLGREVGLAYIHAHIRYVEAMAKIGKTEETWANLEKINPIGIIDTVSNSELRQANAYFSSSDGNFKTRYDAQENFNQLKTKDRTVKGGWRIYSSGPGIYINQLTSNVLGIRKTSNSVIFDPVLPTELDGLCLKYQLDDRLLKINYHLNESRTQLIINGKLIPTEKRKNRYRKEGLSLSLDSFYTNTSIEGTNEIDLFIGEM